MDLVYDSVVDLMQHDTEGWVGWDSILCHAGARGLSRESAEEAILHWEALDVLVLDPASHKLKFVVPPAG